MARGSIFLIFGAGGSHILLLDMSTAMGNFDKPLRVFGNLIGCGMELGIQRTVSEQMAMFMALAATKRDMFIIKRLNPFIVIVIEAY